MAQFLRQSVFVAWMSFETRKGSKSEGDVEETCEPEVSGNRIPPGYIIQQMTVFCNLLTNKVVDYQTKLQRSFEFLTDVRIQKVSDDISCLRITKAFGLESKARREREV